MTTTSTDPAGYDYDCDPWGGCGPDCVLIHGICRCDAEQIATEPMPEWMLAIEPPY